MTLPKVGKALRELRRGLEIARRGGLEAGTKFVSEEVFRNTWTRLRATIPSAASQVECNVCGWKGPRFLTHCAVDYIDRDAFCPRCRSYPRHRGFAWLLEHRFADELAKLKGRDGLRLLFAPEPGLLDLFSNHIEGLEGADLDPASPLVTHQEDLQTLSFADDSVDFVSSFHVLEHVPDDRLALSELHRVLRPDGMMVLCVPITFPRRETLEFGGPHPLLNDHYRDYGEDFPERLVEAGFTGTAHRLMSSVPVELHRRLRLVEEMIFLVRPATTHEHARVREPRQTARPPEPTSTSATH